MKKCLLLFLLCNAVYTSAQVKQPYKLIAYATGEAFAIKQYPIDKLTHIIYSFLKLQNDTLTFRNEAQQKTVEQLVTLKQTYPQLKIMVSVGGWGGCAPCSDLFASEKSRENFAKTTVALFKEFKIDGLDLDWEYPAIEGFPGHKYNTADKTNFTKMVKALRKEMGNDYLLTFAAGGFVKYLEESIDWDEVTPLVDFINLMTYDLVGGYAKVTGHHTPLYDYRPRQESTNKCVNWLIDKKVPAKKLIIGAAMYARVWENVEDSNNGLYQGGKFKQAVSYSSFKTFFADTTGFKYYWDKGAKAPYYYNPVKKLYATFDDSRSIKEKTKYIRNKKLGGIMFWELLNDAKTSGLVDEMSKGLKK